jgi:hypothetical protein
MEIGRPDLARMKGIWYFECLILVEIYFSIKKLKYNWKNKKKY